MAIAEIPLKLDSSGQQRMSGVIINPKNNKSISLNLLPDTGATSTVIDDKYARNLGINITAGTKTPVNNGTVTWYMHDLAMKIGTLKPLISPVLVATGQTNVGTIAILGMRTMLQFKRVTYTGRGTIMFEEVTPSVPSVKKESAYAYTLPAWYSYRKRI